MVIEKWTKGLPKGSPVPVQGGGGTVSHQNWNPPQPPQPPQPPVPHSPAQPEEKANLVERLKQLKALLDAGAITQADYDAKKAEMLKQL